MSFAQGLVWPKNSLSCTGSRGRKVDWQGATGLTRWFTACGATIWPDCWLRDSVLVLPFFQTEVLVVGLVMPDVAPAAGGAR